MKKSDPKTVYFKYLEEQASKIDLEEAKEESEKVCERLRDLSECREITEKWCDDAEKAIGETIEYLNLCTYLCNELYDGISLIFSDVIGVFLELCDLKYSIVAREGLNERREKLLKRLEAVTCDAGGHIIIQDEKYWFCIREMFALDSKSAKAESKDKSDSQKKEEAIECEALKVLKAAMDLPQYAVSVFWLQRSFHFGYGKALEIIAWLEEKGYVQSAEEMEREGLRGRRILVSKDTLDK